ncbi:hypothetical protein BJX63DRAFT_427010 [Aspergillus granulosus]|uniref:Isopropylmalate dehydrogenase-like domain-containing protein n=1 Tax=Aspergillus granulosus TaxID=176169 RepID=A0ABR4I3W2_9EURO
MALSKLKVGVAIGHGTGPELAAVFEKVIQQLAARFFINIEFIRTSRIYHTYATLLATGNDERALTDETIEDAEHYREFCENGAASGLHVIFRTAVSAQSLYLVREQLQAVKVEYFNVGTSAILMIRDQAQGFYSGSNEFDSCTEAVSRTCKFSKAIFHRIIRFAIDRARQIWSDRDIDSVTMVYKFHLFDNLFHSWAREWSADYKVKIDFIQPDTMNRNILAFGLSGYRVLVAGNEYADIMQTMLLDRFGMGAQEENYAENVYLHPELHGLSEYQTIHGSADDIAGKDVVNPSATIRAAAAILEHHAACQDVQAQVNHILAFLLHQNLTTPDQGGSLTTSAFVNHFLKSLDHHEPTSATPGCGPSTGSAMTTRYQAPNPSLAFMGKYSAVVVVDFQNDFVMRGPAGPMERVVTNTPRVLEFARTHGCDVVFIRFLGDEKYQGSSWRYRNTVLRRPPTCLEGSWGAEMFHSVKPRQGENLYEKKAHFDPFLVQEFEDYVKSNNFEHLIFLGLYADVCVDAAAKAAFQRGILISVIQDCTTSIYMKEEDSLDYMRKVYGARLIGSEDFIQMAV